MNNLIRKTFLTVDNKRQRNISHTGKNPRSLCSHHRHRLSLHMSINSSEIRQRYKFFFCLSLLGPTEKKWSVIRHTRSIWWRNIQLESDLFAYVTLMHSWIWRIEQKKFSFSLPKYDRVTCYRGFKVIHLFFMVLSYKSKYLNGYIFSISCYNISLKTVYFFKFRWLLYFYNNAVVS